MKRLLSVLFLFIWTPVLPAGVIDFDDLPYAAEARAVPDGYAGFNWEGISYLSLAPNWTGTGFDPGLSENTNVAFIPETSPFISVSISRPQEFNLESMVIGHVADMTMSDSRSFIALDLLGINDGILTALSFRDFAGPPLAFETLISFAAIDKFEIVYRRTVSEEDPFGFSDEIIIDNLFFTETAVPEPASIVLLILGLGGLLWWGRSPSDKKLRKR